MRLEEFKSIINGTLTDLVESYRYGTVSNTDGTTDSVLSTTPTIHNGACRLSFSQVENPSDKQVDRIPITMTPKLFFKSNADVKPGDYVVITRRTEEGAVMGTYSGHIGLPSLFVTHKEVLFSIEESA